VAVEGALPDDVQASVDSGGDESPELIAGHGLYACRVYTAGGKAVFRLRRIASSPGTTTLLLARRRFRGKILANELAAGIYGKFQHFSRTQTSHDLKGSQQFTEPRDEF
jgi:hypothetical protein